MAEDLLNKAIRNYETGLEQSPEKIFLGVYIGTNGDLPRVQAFCDLFMDQTGRAAFPVFVRELSMAYVVDARELPE